HAWLDLGAGITGLVPPARRIGDERNPVVGGRRGRRSPADDPPDQRHLADLFSILHVRGITTEWPPHGTGGEDDQVDSQSNLSKISLDDLCDVEAIVATRQQPE